MARTFYGYTRNLRFNAGGATSHLVTIDLNDDDVAEDSETMLARLSNAVGAQIETEAGTVTITDDDQVKRIFASFCFTVRVRLTFRVTCP